MSRIYLFKRFERFWHWAQAALILTMMLTGFEIHGVYTLLGFETAVSTHTTTAWALIGLWAFAIFWHFTTGEWKQYIPSDKPGRIFAMAKFYAWGVFTGDPHPYKATPERKHNPLQRLTYLGIKLAVNPLIWITGLLYLFYNSWGGVLAGADLQIVAVLHTVGAFLMLAFLVAHLYLITMGETLFAQLKAMITGWEEVKE
ncbi:MAG: cytochrome b/b6 domain-containing protein [Rhodospirillales bacterium]|nr:cytochrome b/b6 domain-containing protein [Rhodospirillales bacterium]